MKSCEVIPNDGVLKYYFYFIQERMNMFWKKVDGKRHKEWTEDIILKTYKFTNVYRASDRVSQYLIKNIIYNNSERYSPKYTLLRIIVFKIFNKIETREFLIQANQNITIEHFDPHKISILLSQRQLNCPIFSNAYMMTGSHKDYDYLPTKHENG